MLNNLRLEKKYRSSPFSNALIFYSKFIFRVVSFLDQINLDRKEEK